MRHQSATRALWRRALLASLLGSLFPAGAVRGADPATPDPTILHLRQLSLEELLDLEVSTASKKEQRLADTAAAVTVLTGDDLRRSGVTQIPEALRLVPGVQVARLSAHQWAISVRGFNEVFANKLLVMVDGRSVYTPLFSGTLWEYQDLPLESIERIEVVRGPGASVWGANAVNGVINIITKSARDLSGGHFSAGGGNLDQFIATTSLGTSLTEDAWLRFDANFRSHAELDDLAGQPNHDAYTSGTGRFRLDWEPSDGTSFLLLAGGQYAELDEGRNLIDLSVPGYVPAEFTNLAGNGHVLGRWTRVVDERSQIELQTYLDYSDIDSNWIHDRRLNFDVEFNHRWQPAPAHDINWGLGYRLSSDDITTSGDTIAVSPGERSVNLFSAHLQDDWELKPDVLKLTAGVRLEHNDYTGLEVQPTLRGLWKIADNHSLWGSVSRAVRTPSRVENDATINFNLQPPGVVHPSLPAVVQFSGSDDFDAEELWAFELGYRWQPDDQLHFDLTGFVNSYDRLRGSIPGTPFPNDPSTPTYLIIPAPILNDTSGETYGAELGAVWQVTEEWRWRAGYSYLGMSLQGSEAADVEGSAPRHQAFLQSLAQITDSVEFDVTVRYVDELEAPGVPAYVTADVRLGWRPRPDLELSVVGQNLFDSPHQEFGSSLINYDPSAISRAVFGKLTWSF